MPLLRSASGVNAVYAARDQLPRARFAFLNANDLVSTIALVRVRHDSDVAVPSWEAPARSSALLRPRTVRWDGRDSERVTRSE